MIAIAYLRREFERSFRAADRFSQVARVCVDCPHETERIGEPSQMVVLLCSPFEVLKPLDRPVNIPINPKINISDVDIGRPEFLTIGQALKQGSPSIHELPFLRVVT